MERQPKNLNLFRFSLRPTQHEQRFQQWKALKKARKIVESWYRFRKQDTETIEKQARKIRDHRKSCSCYMCRNPRRPDYNKKLAKLTIQELKQIDKQRMNEIEQKSQRNC